MDATLALRELNCILEGTEEDYWDIIEERKDEDTLVGSFKDICNLNPPLTFIIPHIHHFRHF